MISLAVAVSLVLLACIAYYPYKLARNTYYARRTNLPYVTIPYDQNSVPWMVLGPITRPNLHKWLPKWLADRALITIYGWEHHLGLTPFHTWAKGEKTLAAVTAGQFEVHSYDPEFLMDVLKRPKDFHEPSFNALFAGRFGHNLLTTNGEVWAKQRKILASVVNEKLSKVVFGETVLQTRGLLKEVTEGGKKESAETTRAFDMMKQLTIHVLSGAGMGQNVDWINEKERPTSGYRTTYMQSCKTVMAGMAGPIILPSWFLDNYPSFMPGHAFLKELSVAVKEYPLHTKDLLEAERQRLRQPGSQVEANVISQLVHAADGAKPGFSLDESEMVGNIFVFTVAGFDTTANTLSYTLAELLREPRWQTWLFEEIDEILPEDEELDYASLFPKAVRAMAVMYETLRLYTPLTHIPKASHGTQIVHTSKQDYVLPDQTNIYISASSLHRDPSIWRDLNISPTEKAASDGHDEDDYRPSRWINQDGTHFQPVRGTYVPWSFGPRNCPGQKMAQVEFVAAILTLLRRHRIDAVPFEVPEAGEGLGSRLETPAEVRARIEEKIRDSLSIVTLQMNGVYDVPEDAAGTQGLKLKFGKR